MTTETSFSWSFDTGTLSGRAAAAASAVPETDHGPGRGTSSYGVQADTRTTSKGPGGGASSYGVPLAARRHGCGEDPGVTWSEQTDDRYAEHVARESDKLLRARSEKVSSVTRHCASVNLKAESGVIK